MVWNRFQWWDRATVGLVDLADWSWLVQIKLMRDWPQSCVALAPLLTALALGCEASVNAPGDATGGQGSAGSLSYAGSAMLPSGTEPAALLPARIRRLTDAEYQASVSALLGAATDNVAADFVPDSRQSGFTVNEAQRVDPVFARQLAQAAESLANDLRLHVSERAPCADPAGGADACASAFIRSFGERAYRRPLGEDEVAQLLLVFRTAFDGGSYEEGIELTARAMLQSAGFLYLTEIGEAPGVNIKLTPYELASSVSYLVQGRPPSAALLEEARAGNLDTPEGRRGVLDDRELDLFGVDARARVVRVVREWLGIDRIADTAKDSNIYPDFAPIKDAMDRETTEFLQVLVSQKGGSLRQLLAGNWTVANAPLARLYGATAPGDDFVEVSVPSRLGMLNQGAFLSVFSHAHETAPVLRGVRVMRRVACSAVPDPVALTSAVVPPAPDPSKTTRERFAVHAADPECASCHKRIDNFGFAFEQFDGMGRARSQDNGKPVDSSVNVVGTDFDGAYADSNALVSAMAESAQVRECFARHVFRALAGTSAAELQASEDDFVKHWNQSAVSNASGKPETDVVGTLSAYITSPGFAYRRAQ
jgi:hypothetical protein